MKARRPRRLVRRLVLVDQRHRRAGGQRSEQRRARPHGQVRAAGGERLPRGGAFRVLGAGVQARDFGELLQPLRPAARALDVAGDHERSARSREPIQESAFAPASAQDERRLRRDSFACGGHDVRRGTGAGRRQHRERGGPEAGQALTGEEARELECCGPKQGGGVNEPRDRSQPRAHHGFFAHAHDQPHPLGAAEGRRHTLSRADGQVRGNAVRKRLIDRRVEHHVGDARGHRVRRWSYSRLASLRSSQAMRLYSCPGLRRRNAGWNVGIRMADP